jgi:hypothetical protein
VSALFWTNRRVQKAKKQKKKKKEKKNQINNIPSQIQEEAASDFFSRSKQEGKDNSTTMEILNNLDFAGPAANFDDPVDVFNHNMAEVKRRLGLLQSGIEIVNDANPKPLVFEQHFGEKEDVTDDLVESFDAKLKIFKHRVSSMRLQIANLQESGNPTEQYWDMIEQSFPDCLEARDSFEDQLHKTQTGLKSLQHMIANANNIMDGLQANPPSSPYSHPEDSQDDDQEIVLTPKKPNSGDAPVREDVSKEPITQKGLDDEETPISHQRTVMIARTVTPMGVVFHREKRGLSTRSGDRNLKPMRLFKPEEHENLTATSVVAKIPTQKRFALIRESVMKANILKRTMVKVRSSNSANKAPTQWLAARMANYPQQSRSYSHRRSSPASNAACARRRLKMKQTKLRKKLDLQSKN